jgi:hypothetical protein
MTKKDYILLARIIHATRQARPAFSQAFDGQCSAAALLQAELADALKADNPAFSPSRFIEACETGSDRAAASAARKASKAALAAQREAVSRG